MQETQFYTERLFETETGPQKIGLNRNHAVKEAKQGV
jgi:hypothetical protein